MGHVYLYYGTGGGKTANALGLALRSVGHGHRVVIVQFLKWWKETGEYKIAERLKPCYEIRQFGKPGWICSDATDSEITVEGMSFKVRGIDEQDREMARGGLDYARNVLVEKPGLLVLDEVCLAAHLGILDAKDVLDTIRHIPEETDVIMTGRYTPTELIERADFVNEIVEKKAPDYFVMTRGIQF